MTSFECTTDGCEQQATTVNEAIEHAVETSHAMLRENNDGTTITVSVDYDDEYDDGQDYGDDE